MKLPVLIPIALVVCTLMLIISFVTSPGQLAFLTGTLASIVAPDSTPGVRADNGTGHIYFEIKYGENKYITDATVTLYQTTPDDAANMTLADVPGNPLTGVNAKLNRFPALYRFENVPYGFYLIYAERNGVSWKFLKMLDQSSADSVSGCIVDDPYLKVPDTAHPGTGVVYGWVRNPSNGDYISGVTVTLLRQNGDNATYDLAADISGNPARSLSNQYTGFYSFQNVPPGKYILRTECNDKFFNSMLYWINGTEENGIMVNLAWDNSQQ